MEASSHFHSVDPRESGDWAQAIILSLLLNAVDDSPVIVAAGASKSNLFFSAMFGASAEPRFAVAPSQRASF